MYIHTCIYVGLLGSTILILVHAALTRPYLIQLLCPEVVSYSIIYLLVYLRRSPLLSFPLEEKIVLLSGGHV